MTKYTEQSASLLLLLHLHLHPPPLLLVSVPYRLADHTPQDKHLRIQLESFNEKY